MTGPGGGRSVRAAVREVGGASITRRRFLVRAGVLGAAAAAGGAWPLRAGAAPLSPVIDEIAGPAMRMLASDTVKGLAVFAVPGPDPYSRAQGLTSDTSGPIESGTYVAILEGLDDFLPFPDSYAQEMAAALTTAVSDVPIPAELLAGLPVLGEQAAASLDRALAAFLTNDDAVPLSLVVALMLNFEAGHVNPAAVAGPFPASPFANLSWPDKGRALSLLERGDADLVAALDEGTPQPLRASLSGFMRYVAGTLLEFAGYTAYTEVGVFDRQTRRARSRPPGWEISQYMPGRTTPADGWDELRGYYQGRRSTETAPEFRGA
jgi:hypothetical protein